MKEYRSINERSGSSSWDFNRSSQQVANNVQKITQNVSQLQRMIAQIGTSSDTPELRDKLHQLQHYTNQLAKETSQKLTELVNLPNVSSSSEQRLRKMHKDRLMNDFTAALSNFQLAQRQEKDKEASTRSRPLNYDAFLDDKKGEYQLVPIDGPGLMQAEEEEVDVKLLEEREKSMCQLEADIMDVNQIFKDLALLVHEQNDAIDSIEASVETAAINVEHGVEQLQKARFYQSKVKRKKVCLFVVLGCVLTIIITFVVLAVKL